ncbi:MAG: hypothetical protein Q4G26_04690 [Paracoccus sp. (in: a-proteobacteria)]|nr:hypothetical protein [Paracoccus sp. (in: a-proteobacteria)]
MRHLILLLPLLLLAACGTPQERCIARHTSEYRALSALLSETEGNLARGYAWEERTVSRMELESCPRIVRGRDGEARVIDTSCWRRVADTERYRVPIDPAAEMRARDYLAEKLRIEAPRAQSAIGQCKAAYPEEK